MNIGIDKIRIDGGTQSRVKIDKNVVAQYADDILNGDEFPPVVLFTFALSAAALSAAALSSAFFLSTAAFLWEP